MINKVQKVKVTKKKIESKNKESQNLQNLLRRFEFEEMQFAYEYTNKSKAAIYGLSENND